MRRRALLAALAAGTTSVGASGCLSTAGPPFSDPPTVESGDEISMRGSSFELGAPRPQVTFVDQKWPYWDAEGSDDDVFAVIPLDPTNGEDGAAAAVRDATIAGELDGERVTEPDAVLANRDDQPPVLVGVPFPTGGGSDRAAVVFEDARGARLELDADFREYLADPPDLTIEPRIPAETDGNALAVSLEVTNDGESDGTLAWTTTHGYISDAWWTHRDDVAPGQTRSFSQEWTDLGSPDTGAEISVTLDWGFDERREKVVVARD